MFQVCLSLSYSAKQSSFASNNPFFSFFGVFNWLFLRLQLDAHLDFFSRLVKS